MVDVVVVDDHEVERLGRELLLRRLGVDVAAGDWAQATGLLGTTRPALAVLVVRRDVSSWDRFRALHAAGDLRRTLGGSGHRLVAVADAAVLGSPLVRLRLAAAGIDEALLGSELATGDALAQLVSGALAGRSVEPSAAELDGLRVGRRSAPGVVVERVLQLAERDPAYLRAFQAGHQQNDCGLTRRRAHTLRVKVAELGDLRTDPGRWSGGPVRDQSLPRWSEVVAFVNRCRGWHPDDDTLDLFLRREQVEAASDESAAARRA